MPDRRLAAILAADVVGYSALMAEDEVGTLEALRRLRRELFHPAVAGHRGKVVKSMGDGWLVEFASAVDAVNCALRIQTGLEADPMIRVRIGIHVGDITHEDEDIYGDGVNVAARLEALAEPGAVAISDAVYGTLDGTQAPVFDDGGEHTLKNIARPVRVWLRGSAGMLMTASDAADDRQRAGYPVIVAVVPVSTSDRRDEIRELAAALTNDLFAYLDNGRWMTSVVAETPPQGAYVLTTTLRGSGERLRLDVSVLAPDGGLIWSHRLDGTLGDVFDWQDEAGREIATSVGAAVFEDVRTFLARLRDDEQTAATCMLAAMTPPLTRPKHAVPAFEAIERAIELDPEWALPYAWGCMQILFLLSGGSDSARSLYAERFDEWLECARRTSDGEPLAGLILAFVANRREPSPDAVLMAVRDMLKRRPLNQMALWIGGMTWVYRGEPEAGIGYIRKLVTFNIDPSLRYAGYSLLANAYCQLERDEEAIAAARQSVAGRPDAPIFLRTLVASLAQSGRIDEARAVCARMLDAAPETTVQEARQRFMADTPGIRRYLDGLRLAGLPEGDE